MIFPQRIRERIVLLQPLPSRKTFDFLRLLSVELGWREVTQHSYVDNQYLQGNEYTFVAFYWMSPESYGSQLTIAPKNGGPVKKADVNEPVELLRKFDIWVISYEHRIYAGPIEFKIQSPAKIKGLSEILGPLIHRSNFSTKLARKKLLEAHPYCQLPTHRSKVEWRPTRFKIYRRRLIIYHESDEP